MINKNNAAANDNDALFQFLPLPLGDDLALVWMTIIFEKDDVFSEGNSTPFTLSIVSEMSYKCLNFLEVLCHCKFISAPHAQKYNMYFSFIFFLDQKDSKHLVCFGTIFFLAPIFDMKWPKSIRSC